MSKSKEELPKPYEGEATVTSKGQVTVPAGIRERLDIRAGDKLRFHIDELGKLTVIPRKRRSIFEHLDELKLPSLGRPVTDADIDAAIETVVKERYERARGKRPR
jgi:antitoxin PrlF